MAEDMENIRKLEPVSRVLRAFGVPPPESIIPTPREILLYHGIPLLEDKLLNIKVELHNMITKFHSDIGIKR